MAVKRTTKPVKWPDGTARAGVKKRAAKKTTAKKAAVKKAAVKKAGLAAKVATTVAKTSSRISSKTSAKALAKAVAAKAVAAREATVARTQRLVDETPLVIDDGDGVAKTKVAALREAKARAPDHQGRARRSAVERANDPPPAAGQALIERVSRAIERELTQIEVIVGGQYVAPRQRTEAERRARTLARTLREVTTLRLSEKKEKREDDDAVPRDLGELRLALARRLDQLVADAKTAHPDAAE